MLKRILQVSHVSENPSGLNFDKCLFKKEQMCLYSFFHYNAFFIFVGDFLTVVLISIKIKTFGKDAEHRALLQKAMGRCEAEKLLLEIKQVLELKTIFNFPQTQNIPDLSQGQGEAVWIKLKGKPP